MRVVPESHVSVYNTLDSRGCFEDEPSGDDFPEPLPDSDDTPVTLIVAIATDTAIVMASDGQTTAGGGKLPATSKLKPIHFRESCALFGEAGDNAISGRAMQQLEDVSGLEKIVDRRTVPKAAQSAMLVAREELRAQNFGCSGPELNRVIRDRGDCEWLAGYLFRGKPVLFKLRMSAGIDSQVKSQYAAIGSGRLLAEYLLARVVRPRMNIVEAEMAAVYVVEEVKKIDLYCSGQTHVAFVGLDFVVTESPERLRKIIRDSATTERIVRDSLSQIFRERFIESVTAFNSAWQQIEAYTKKHPEAEKMTVGQIVRKMNAEHRKKKPKRKR